MDQQIRLPHVYGNNLKAYLCRDPECILSGPADTGKTIAMLTKLHFLAMKHSDASIVIARKRLTDTYSTVLVTWQKQILKQTLGEGKVRAYGGEKAQWYDYPNGSRIWVAGLDKAGKILSAEHDLIFINQAEEVSLADWETLTTRATGRAGHIPYPQVLGDCNPASPTHWIRARVKSGQLAYFESRHRDNPDLYDQATGEMTEEGQRRIGALDRLTGVRHMRLRKGLWAAPEGAIYDCFDEERHKVVHFTPPPLWPRVVGIDPFGASIAAVWLAFDAQNGVLNVYREYCKPFGITVRGHADNMQKLSRGETIFVWVGGGPSERAWRLEFASAGIPVIEPGVAEVWVGIDRVHQLLRDFSLVIHDNCVGLLSEIGEYRRKIGRDGMPTETIEKKEDFHLLDSLRYACAWLSDPRQGHEIVYRPLVQERDY